MLYTNRSSPRLYLHYLCTWDFLGYLKPEGGVEGSKANCPDMVAVIQHDTPWTIRGSRTNAPLFWMNQKSQITGTIIRYSGQMHDFVAWMLCSANKLLAYCCLACIYVANCRLTCAAGRAALPCPEHSAYPCYLVKPSGYLSGLATVRQGLPIQLCTGWKSSQWNCFPWKIIFITQTQDLLLIFQSAHYAFQ